MKCIFEYKLHFEPNGIPNAQGFCSLLLSSPVAYPKALFNNVSTLTNLSNGPTCPENCTSEGSCKGRSHYSDNQSPTSNNHYFWGGCRRLSEIGKCLSMIGDWLSENYIDNLSPTSDNHPFSGWFSMVGKWLLMIAEQFWSARGFRCSINNHRQPNKAAIQNEYTFDPEKCR